MRYVSTRGNSPAVSFSDAVCTGLCPDGGLYVPQAWPALDVAAVAAADGLPAAATLVLEPFFVGDPLADELAAVCTDALSFDVPLVALRGPRSARVLELFHGPTAAFKDIGARFLARCLERGPAPAAGRWVLVATSGDTGGAVAAAFWRRPGFRVAILFPKDGVSARQRHQLCCWGDNVRSFAVRGSFDDCQRLLKRALADPGWQDRRSMTTANSINIGRLLPQVVYYVCAAVAYQRQCAVAPDFVVPSGNVGNATAALWAKRIGAPIDRVVLAHNSNRTVPDYLGSGVWRPRPSVATLANAMDVGDPSNMERVQHLYPSVEELRRDVVALSVDDGAIEAEIRSGPAQYDRVWDPHTATAIRAVTELDLQHPIVVATAHAAKFDGIVEPLVGRPVELPPSLAELLERPARCTEIGPDLAALDAALSGS